jgi:hypothetical protein
MKEKTSIIVIHESVAQSWARDASSFVMAVVMMGVGVWLESGAMQWVGAFMWFLAMLNMAMNAARKMTVAEARKRLDEIEGGQA